MLRHIKPDDLIFEWERVRAGLLEVMKHSAEDWLPEDVYLSLKTGNSALYVAEDAQGDYLGFVVLQVLPMFHGKRLHVWCAHSTNTRWLVRTFNTDVQALAKEIGAKKVTFTSPRPEWQRVALRGGFKPSQTTYEISL